MTLTIPFSNVVVETGTVTRMRRIDGLYDCVTTNPLIPCPPCFPADGQIMYFSAGDIFTYNLPFTATTIRVLRFDGTLVGTYNNWIQGNTIVVNVNNLPADVNCFYIQVVFRGETSCFEFGFLRTNPLEDSCGIGTITIESTYTSGDCHGNVYGGTPAYSNLRRFKAEVEYIGNIEQADMVDDVRISTKIYNQYQIRILQPLRQDSLLLSELVEVIMRGKNPTITIANGFPADVIICTDFTEAITRSYDTTREWFPVFVVRSLQCDLSLNCN